MYIYITQIDNVEIILMEMCEFYFITWKTIGKLLVKTYRYPPFVTCHLLRYDVLPEKIINSTDSKCICTIRI